MKYLLLVFLVFNLFISQSFASRAYPYKSDSLSPGAYGFDMNFLYSKTLNFYDVDGNDVELEEYQNFGLIDSDVTITYGYSRKLDLYFSGKYRQVTSEAGDEEESTTTTTSGFESGAIGFKYTFKPTKDYRYAISGEYRTTFYENDVYSDASKVPETDLVLGDSGNSFLINFYLDYIISKVTSIEMIVGYNSPANDLSPEAPYRFSLVKSYKKLALWGGVKGTYSFGLDSYADDPTSKPANANGSTYRWNSINRSYMQPFGGLSYLFKNKYRASFEFGQTVSGTSTDKSFDAIFNLSWASGGVSKESNFEQSFKEYTTEATIIKISPRGKFLKIDKGLTQDISKGARVDIYKTDFFGGNILVASGVIYESGPTWAIVRLVKKYRSVPIEKGFTARVK